MKLYLLWFNDWEESSLLAMFQDRRDAERWREYFLATSTNEEDDDYLISTMAHFANKGDLADRLNIGEFTVDSLNPDIKIDNLKLLEWEAHKDEKANT